MKFGPFSESDADRIEGVLNDKGISCVRSHSEKQVELWREQDRARFPSNHPTFQGLIENIYLEISESDLGNLGTELEAYGIVLAGDGETEFQGNEDYLCPRCKYSSTNPGLCPRHLIPLVTFSEKAQTSIGLQQQQQTRFWMIAILGFMIAMAIIFYVIISKPV